MPEPELIQLIDELQQLRTWVEEVGVGDQTALLYKFTGASTALFRLKLARSRAANERELQLSEALRAIRPDYAIEAIDEAIRAAQSQMPEPELVQLIDELQQLRTQVEAGAADQMVLNLQFMAASAALSRLSIARSQAARGRELQLSKPLHAILPGYAIEAIGEAIGAAQEQM
jgi:hypothetical protein